MTRTPNSAGLGRLLLLAAAVLFLVAGVAVLAHAKLPVEALALLGFACWAGSGALV